MLDAIPSNLSMVLALMLLSPDLHYLSNTNLFFNEFFSPSHIIPRYTVAQEIIDSKWKISKNQKDFTFLTVGRVSLNLDKINEGTAIRILNPKGRINARSPYFQLIMRNILGPNSRVKKEIAHVEFDDEEGMFRIFMNYPHSFSHVCDAEVHELQIKRAFPLRGDLVLLSHDFFPNILIEENFRFLCFENDDLNLEMVIEG